MPIVSKEIEVSRKVKIGGKHSLFLIGGPCVIESMEHAFFMAKEIKKVCEALDVPFIYKASYDKANRSSLKSYRGPGLEKGLEILRRVKDKAGVPVLSDVHETSQIEKAARVLDVIQIPAFLCRQTDLVLEAARTKKPINIKKGQFISPQEMENAVEKIVSQGNENIILTERGTFFGYNNLVFDIRSIPIMKKFGFPVVIDVSHIVQKPGGRGVSSGGDAEFIPIMARAGVAVGADGLFIEIHDEPRRALSDKHNSLKISKLKELLAASLKIRKAIEEDGNSDE